MSSTIIKPSAAIRQNYNDISNLAKETHSPIFLTKNGEGDLVVMDIETYGQREKQAELPTIQEGEKRTNEKSATSLIYK